MDVPAGVVYAMKHDTRVAFPSIHGTRWSSFRQQDKRPSPRGYLANHQSWMFQVTISLTFVCQPWR